MSGRRGRLHTLSVFQLTRQPTQFTPAALGTPILEEQPMAVVTAGHGMGQVALFDHGLELAAGSAAPAGRPDDPAERQTHSRPQARSSAPTRRDACRGALRLPRRRDFTTGQLHREALAALGTSPEAYPLGSLRYDLSKLRIKGLVEKMPYSRPYRLLPHGYAICLVFLKLFERIYAPLAAGLLRPVAADSRLPHPKRHHLDRLYQRVVDDLDELIRTIGLKVAA